MARPVVAESGQPKMDFTSNQSLELWRRVMVSALRRELPDLTARQFALLLQVYMTDPPHTVRSLAGALNMSKPAVTRALDRLQHLDFLRRKTDSADRRSVLVQRTVKGSVFLREFGDSIGEAGKELI